MKLNDVRLKVMKFIVTQPLSDVANANQYYDLLGDLKINHLQEADNYMDWLHSFAAYEKPFPTSIDQLKDINKAIDFYAGDIDDPHYNDIIDLAVKGQDILNKEAVTDTYFVDNDTPVTWEQLGFKIKERTKGAKYHDVH